MQTLAANPLATHPFRLKKLPAAAAHDVKVPRIAMGCEHRAHRLASERHTVNAEHLPADVSNVWVGR